MHIKFLLSILAPLMGIITYITIHNYSQKESIDPLADPRFEVGDFIDFKSTIEDKLQPEPWDKKIANNYSIVVDSSITAYRLANFHYEEGAEDVVYYVTLKREDAFVFKKIGDSNRGIYPKYKDIYIEFNIRNEEPEGI